MLRPGERTAVELEAVTLATFRVDTPPNMGQQAGVASVDAAKRNNTLLRTGDMQSSLASVVYREPARCGEAQ